MDPARLRQVRLYLFLAAWGAFAFFHQGGGWNQNGRFAMVRAIVEQGRFAIDDYLFYSEYDRADGHTRFERLPIEDGTFTIRNRLIAVGWPGAEPVPVREEVPEGATLTDMSRYVVTGDLAFSRGHFYPNKAPGTALAAVPGYALVHAVERLAGLDPDDWWVLTVNAWLAGVLSVGLLAALGVVAFFNVALTLWGGPRAAVWASLTFAFGTLYFPYATMLFEHDLVAALLIIGFGLLLRAQRQAPSRGSLVLAGLALGWASISTYIFVVPLAMIVAWSIWRARGLRHLLWLGLGLALPFATLCLYNQAAFGWPFTTNYHFQNPQFQEQGAFLSVLGAPGWKPFVGVLVSPFRGLFFSSPVLLVALAGLGTMARRRELRAEAVLFAGVFAFFLLFNASFNGWDGGWGVGPRYLIPAIPLLALPLALAFERWFTVTALAGALSIFTMGAFTAVDPQSPLGSTKLASFPGRPALLHEPLTGYALPLLWTGRARPVLDAQIDDLVVSGERELADQGVPAAERETQLADYRERLWRMVDEGDVRILLSFYHGPVSVNPQGFHEGWLGQLIRPPAPENAWNAFNAGELLWPASRASLLWLAIFVLPLGVSALRRAEKGTDLFSALPLEGTHVVHPGK